MTDVIQVAGNLMPYVFVRYSVVILLDGLGTTGFKVVVITKKETVVEKFSL